MNRQHNSNCISQSVPCVSCRWTICTAQIIRRILRSMNFKFTEKKYLHSEMKQQQRARKKRKICRATLNRSMYSIVLHSATIFNIKCLIHFLRLCACVVECFSFNVRLLHLLFMHPSPSSGSSSAARHCMTSPTEMSFQTHTRSRLLTRLSANLKQ